MEQDIVDICVCMGSSCFARGNSKNLEFIENFIKENKLNARINLSGSRCENKCTSGPNIIINNKPYTQITESELEEILLNTFCNIIK